VKQVARIRTILLLGWLLVVSRAGLAADDLPETGGTNSKPVSHKATSPATIDIQQFEVLKLDTTTTTEKLVISHVVLTFKNSDIRIDMGSSAELVKGVHPWPYYGCGYTDPKSLKVCWLVQGKIFRATWHTLACGSGIYDTQVDVLMLVEGGKGREILRQSYTINARTDSQEHTHTAVTFSAKEEKSGPNRVTVLRTVEIEDVFVEINAAIHWPLGDDFHRQMSVVREVTRYELQTDGSFIESVNTQACIDLSEKYVNVERAEVNMYKKMITLDELSEFLVLYGNRRFALHRDEGASMPRERKQMVQELKNRNRDIADKPYCTGKIEIPHSGILFPPLTPGQAPAG
jgi:hypothetical protein